MPSNNIQTSTPAGKRNTQFRHEEPPQYRVVLHNDDFTTMDFVVMLLQTVFYKDEAEAEAIMMAIHLQGKGTAGIYPYDIAQSKTAKSKFMARTSGYPLQVTCEPVE